MCTMSTKLFATVAIFDSMLHTDNSNSIITTTYTAIVHCQIQIYLLSFLSEQLSFNYNYLYIQSQF